MNVRPYFLLLLLFINCSVVHAGPAEEWIESTWQSEGDGLYTESEVNAFLKEAEPIIINGSDNPIFYLTIGHFVRMLHSYYYDKTDPLGKYHMNNPESQALIKKYQSYFRMALDKDDNPDAPEHLDAYTLSFMADDVLAAPDIKERAYRKAIALAQAGKADVESENYEYTTYQFLLESYSAQENPDKYLQTLNEMIERFGSSEEFEGYKRHVEEVIAKRDGKAVSETAQQDDYADAKSNEIVKAKAAEVKKAERPTAEVTDKDSEQTNSLWLLLGGGIVLLGLFGFFMNRRKKR